MVGRGRPPREFYERLWAGGSDRENAARWSFQAGLVATAVERLGDVRGRVVLEVGPGSGAESRALSAAGARLIALDVAIESLLRTRTASAERALVVCGAAEALPLAAGTVDLVFAQTVLMHLDLPAAAAEWARVLRPGGRVVVLEPIAGNPLVGLYRRLLSPYRATRPRYVTVADLARAHPALELVAHQEHFLFSVATIALPRALSRPAFRLLDPVDRRLLRWPPLARLAWMTLAELRRESSVPHTEGETAR